MCLEVEDQEGLVMKRANAIADPTELVHSRDANLSQLEDMIRYKSNTAKQVTIQYTSIHY